MNEVYSALNVNNIGAKARITKQSIRRLRQQQEEPRRGKRRLEDLLFYHRTAIDTGTSWSKSSKLAKVKLVFGDGEQSALLCFSVLAPPERQRIQVMMPRMCAIYRSKTNTPTLLEVRQRC